LTKAASSAVRLRLETMAPRSGMVSEGVSILV
jgi:hypothetical protein